MDGIKNSKQEVKFEELPELPVGDNKMGKP